MTPTTDAILELFPRCAGCGTTLTASVPVTRCADRNRLLCATCAPTRS